MTVKHTQQVGRAQRDPRGPLRTITKVERRLDGTAVTLDCGHVNDWNQIYTYRVGDEGRCYNCKLEAKS